jgi:N-methylhydantoinase B/oxoprolinase/acetone carboxylase alpha subunit
VLQDVKNGFVSKEVARNVYGVVMGSEDKRLDPEDTIALRSRLTLELLKNEP